MSREILINKERPVKERQMYALIGDLDVTVYYCFFDGCVCINRVEDENGNEVTITKEQEKKIKDKCYENEY